MSKYNEFMNDKRTFLTFVKENDIRIETKSILSEVLKKVKEATEFKKVSYINIVKTTMSSLNLNQKELVELINARSKKKVHQPQLSQMMNGKLPVSTEVEVICLKLLKNKKIIAIKGN